VLFDGKGKEAIGEIQSFEQAETDLLFTQTAQSEPLRCAITLAQAIPKGKNMELIIQKATELGVSRIVPLLSERTIIQLAEGEDGRRVEKWRQVVIEAAKQCGQNWLPAVDPPVSLKKFFSEFDRYEAPLIASLQTGVVGFSRATWSSSDEHPHADRTRGRFYSRGIGLSENRRVSASIAWSNRAPSRNRCDL
jgi:16S rRNA (uracil1498-N3)-methyltransferase